MRSRSASAVVESAAASSRASAVSCGAADRRRQIVDINDLMIAEGDGAGDAIFEFAHVSRPIVLQKALHGRGRDLNVFARRHSDRGNSAPAGECRSGVRAAPGR